MLSTSRLNNLVCVQFNEIFREKLKKEHRANVLLAREVSKAKWRVIDEDNDEKDKEEMYFDSRVTWRVVRDAMKRMRC